MADFTLEGLNTNTPETTASRTTEEKSQQGNADNTFLAEEIMPSPITSIKGLSEEEITDPNAIRVTIDDTTTPIVVLFGPPTCGKTMTLVRLTRYLCQHGYEVRPVETFRPAADTHYQKMCEHFNEMVHSHEAAEGTSNISFMLVNVTQKGCPICQILEAPGEGYYLPQADTGTFPPYVNNIISNSNRKIWLFVVEPNWMDEADRQGYAAKIKKLQTKIKRQDKAVFLFNKIDQTPFVQSGGHINTSAAIKSIKDQYKGIFEPFRNENPITRFFSEYRCEFVPFSTGDYTPKIDGGKVYEQGDDIYPHRLWNTILKIRKG